MNNPHRWRRTFWRWFPRFCGHIFDVVMFLFICAALAWITYFGIMAP